VELRSDEVAALLGGAVVGAGARPGRGIAFDSRALEPGEVFVALRAERDGHDFVADARARGAAFAITERPVDGTPCVVVDDVGRALLALAREARRRLDVTVVGITGSVGKTSTKDFALAAIGRTRRVHGSPASFNNEIGVPVTLVGAADDAEVVVVEMGARFAGNITALCDIARPDVGVLTNVGLNHAEHLGGPAGIAATKGELLEALPASGLAVVADDCDLTAGQLRRSAAPVVRVGSTPAADVRIGPVVLDDALRARFDLGTPWGSGRVVLGARGAHQARNAAQAATVALHLGVPFAAVQDALAGATVSGWRMELVEVGGVRVLNDAYNAAPASVVAALDALGALAVPGRRVAVLGEMRELGPHHDSEHRAVGEHLVHAGVAVAVVVGEAAAALADAVDPRIELHRVRDAGAATELVSALVRPGDAVLVKASRAVGLEVVATRLVEAHS
jgi:UDP-N-acetylmuramoyl-tripeptide--D-alanyl-D-alanine ligase